MNAVKATIFYSWQSDIKAAANRTLILDALEGAATDLIDYEAVTVQPVIDRDTMSVPGAPDIGSTIFAKIDASAAIVSDVTIVNGANEGRPTPNPNVLVELGYALKALGDRRVILVQNTAFGAPELLPFDLRQKRILAYSSPEDATSRSGERQALRAKLREALTLILSDTPAQRSAEYPVVLAIGYQEVKKSSERHEYQLQVTLKNIGTRVISEWHVDVEFPTPLLLPVTYAFRVDSRSDRQRSLFRTSQDSHRGSIYPGDTKLALTVDYVVDERTFAKRATLFKQSVVAAAYAHGQQVATANKVVEDLQHF
jgi:hypothetical protein